MTPTEQQNLKDFDQLTEDEQYDCCKALYCSLQMTIHEFMKANEIHLSTKAVLSSLMMLACYGVDNLSQEAKQEHISIAIAFLRDITKTKPS